MTVIKMPQAGSGVKSGTVRRWLKPLGQAVGQGEALVEMETEEGLLILESPVAGRLGEILVPQGKTAPVHARLAIMESEGGSVSESKPAANAAGAGAAAGGGKVIPILMPKAGQSMEEGTILKWRVQVGAMIQKGDVIFEVETDKANMDVEAQDGGRLARIIVGEGQSLAVLQPVAFIAENDADVDLFLSGSPAPGTAVAAPPRAAEGAGPAGRTGTGGGERRQVEAPRDATRIKASPAARKIAEERQIDLSAVGPGSGPGGRILSGDVPRSAGPSRRRLAGMRKAIARSLLISKQTIPHFYVRLTVDASPALAFYQAQKAKYPCSINDVIVVACAKLLQEFPAFRTRLENEEIVEAATSNIGIAVGLDEGLVVPVITGAERMTLEQIAGETRRLAAAARAGKIEGMGTGSFTITNLGMFGTEEFAAIINPPEAAILAVGAAREAVVVKEGALKAGKVMTLTLSADHRVIDGLLAAKFLARMKEVLQSPEGLLK